MRRVFGWGAGILVALAVGGVGGYVLHDRLGDDPVPVLTAAEQVWCAGSEDIGDFDSAKLERLAKLLAAMDELHPEVAAALYQQVGLEVAGVFGRDARLERTLSTWEGLRVLIAEVNPKAYADACKAAYEIEVNT